MKRREFLQSSLLTLGTAALPSFLSPLANAQVAAGKHMVFIFLRGGADSLAMVPPTGTQATQLAAWRPNVTPAGAIPISPTLALHSGFAPIWNDLNARGDFNVVINSGSIYETRSHFEQQAIIECGNSSTILSDGFLVRASQLLNQSAVGVSSQMPASLRGGLGQAILLQDPAQLDAYYTKVNMRSGLTRAQRLGLYMNAAGETGDALIHHHASIANSQYELLSTQLAGQTAASLVNNGGYYINTNNYSSLFAQRLALAAALIGSGLAPGIVSVDGDQGWDTHQNQNTNSPSTWNSFGWKIDDLVKNLLAFRNDLVRRGKWANTIVVVMSEFGRTIKENPSLGTDHGRGGAMLLFGGNIRPHSDVNYASGLATARQWVLPTSVDSSTALSIQIDHRAVLAEILERHCGIPQTYVIGASGLFYGQLAAYQYLKVLKV